MRRAHSSRAPLVLVAALAASAFAAVTLGGGPAHAAASLEIQQTCSARIPANTRASVAAAVRNTGDEVFTSVIVRGDAGTPDNEGDDFTLTLSSGDNGNGRLDPGETWTLTGAYTVREGDTANVVTVEATTADGETVDDLDACTTDVIEEPQPGVRAGAREVSGRILIRLPGTNRFVDLNGTTELPIGTEVDATAGRIELVAGLGGGQTNRAEFYAGAFVIRQRRVRRAVMMLWLSRGNFGACRAGNASSLGARPRRKVRRLWGDGKGRFGTRGRYSAATVRGTRWLVEDRCDGTLTLVAQGTVRVDDFVRARSRVVRSGRSYFARAPRR